MFIAGRIIYQMEVLMGISHSFGIFWNISSGQNMRCATKINKHNYGVEIVINMGMSREWKTGAPRKFAMV